MTATRVRGACPTLARPMATGDGLLARLDLAGTHLSPAMLAGLCASARAFGNGLLEVTRRGSVQVRGLRPDSVDRFREAAAALGIESAEGVPIISPALAGLDPTEVEDVRPLAAELRDGLASIDGLAPKFSIVLDGSGPLHLDALAADVRLVAEAAERGVRYRLAIGGAAADALTIGSLAPTNAVPAVLALARMIAARGKHARARDLVRSLAAEAIRSGLAVPLSASPPTPPRPPAEAIGVHALSGGRVAIGVGFAFGQAKASALAELARAAVREGADAFAPAPARTLLAIGIAGSGSGSFLEAADRLGFVTRADDPRRSVAACAGAPDCASGKMPARRIAPEIARLLAPILDGSVVFHVSGCRKGCACPAPATVTLVGAESGYDIVVAGRADGAPAGRVSPDALARRLAGLAGAVADARRPGERTAHVLGRLGPPAVTAHLAGELADA